jgi:hypothetical protein
VTSQAAIIFLSNFAAMWAKTLRLAVPASSWSTLLAESVRVYDHRPSTLPCWMATNDDYFYEVDRAALNRALKLVVSGSDAIDAQQVRATSQQRRSCKALSVFGIITITPLSITAHKY